jgi:hypothetical protein
MSDGWIILGILAGGFLLWYFVMPRYSGSQRAKQAKHITHPGSDIIPAEPDISLPIETTLVAADIIPAEPDISLPIETTLVAADIIPAEPDTSQKLDTQLFDLCGIEIHGSCLEGFDGEIIAKLIITGETETDILSGDNILMFDNSGELVNYNPVISIKPKPKYDATPTFSLTYGVGGPVMISSIVLIIENAEAVTYLEAEVWDQTHEREVIVRNEAGADTINMNIFDARHSYEAEAVEHSEQTDFISHEYLYGVNAITMEGQAGRGVFQVDDLEIYDLNGNLVDGIVVKTAANIDSERNTKMMDGLLPVKINTIQYKEPRVFIAFILERPTTCSAIKFKMKRDAPIVLQYEIETVDGQYDGMVLNPKGEIDILDSRLRFRQRQNYSEVVDVAI